MIIQFLTSTGFRCFTLPYKEYNIWDNIEIYSTLLSLAILYVGCTYYLLSALKLITDRLKSILTTKNAK